MCNCTFARGPSFPSRKRTKKRMESRVLRTWHGLLSVYNALFALTATDRALFFPLPSSSTNSVSLWKILLGWRQKHTRGFLIIAPANDKECDGWCAGLTLPTFFFMLIRENGSSLSLLLCIFFFVFWTGIGCSKYEWLATNYCFSLIFKIFMNV